MIPPSSPSSLAQLRWKRNSAFSLLELVMVIMIVGVFAAIAVPRYANSLALYRVDCAAKRVAADLQYARMLAMTRSKPQSVAFSTTTGTYTLNGVESLASKSQTYVVPLISEPYNTNIATASFGASSTVTFDTYGSPSNPGLVTVQCGSAVKTITLDAITGKVSIQ